MKRNIIVSEQLLSLVGRVSFPIRGVAVVPDLS